MSAKTWIPTAAFLVAAAAGALALQRATARADAPAVERGKYLVTAMGCADCHTPTRLGKNGPEKDPALFLAGHPEKMTLPPPPALPAGPWVATVAGSMTAWAGPWGVSYPANLTPDPEAGIGAWTEETFLKAVRTGRHMGTGRPILPPMPVEPLSHLDDGDLRAVFAYLKSLPPIRNRVPEPLPPAEAPGAPSPR